MVALVEEHHFASFTKACEALMFRQQPLLCGDDFLQLTDVERCALLEAYMVGKTIGMLVVHGSQGLEAQMRAAEQRVALAGRQLALLTINPRLPEAAHAFVLVFSPHMSFETQQDPVPQDERFSSASFISEASTSLAHTEEGCKPVSKYTSGSDESKDVSEKLLKGLGDLVWLRSKPAQEIHQQPVEEPCAIVVMTIDAMSSLLVHYAQERAAVLGKQVHVVTHGAVEEIEPCLLQRLVEILQALVGNAVEHGIELPAQRLAAGKPEVGVVTIQWGLENGKVSITVQDDGAGIGLDGLRDVLVRERILTREMAQFLAADELTDYFFTHTFNDWHSHGSQGPIALPQVRARICKFGGEVRMHVGAVGTMVRLIVPLALPDEVVRVGLWDGVCSLVRRMRKWFGG